MKFIIDYILKKIAYRKMNGNYRDFHNSPPIPPVSSILMSYISGVHLLQ